MKKPVVSQIVFFDIRLEDLRVLEAAQVHGLVGDGPERLLVQVVPLVPCEVVDDQNQFGERDSSILTNVRHHLGRRLSVVLQILVDLGSDALPTVIPVGALVLGWKATRSLQVPDHALDSGLDVDVAEVAVRPVVLNDFFVAVPGRRIERHSEAANLNPVVHLDSDSGELSKFFLEAAPNLGVFGVLNEVDELLRDDVVSVEEHDSSVE